MRLHLVNAKALAGELARGEVDPEAQAHYLWIGFVFFNVIYYAGLAITIAPLWSLPSFFEAVAAIAINIFGVFQSFEAAGGRANRSFLVEFTCLYVPVTITTLVAVWALYWAVRVVFHNALVGFAADGSRFALNLAQIGTDLVGFLTFAAATAGLGLGYWRMVRLLRTVQQLKQQGGGRE